MYSEKFILYSAIHLLVFGSDEIIELKSNRIDIRSFYSSPGINQDLLKPIKRSSFPLEQLFFTGEIGSVRRHCISSGQIKAIKYESKASVDDIIIKKIFTLRY